MSFASSTVLCPDVEVESRPTLHMHNNADMAQATACKITTMFTLIIFNNAMDT